MPDFVSTAGGGSHRCPPTVVWVPRCGPPVSAQPDPDHLTTRVGRRRDPSPPPPRLPHTYPTSDATPYVS